MRSRFGLMAVALAMLVAAVACGSGEAEPTQADPTQQPSNPTVEPQDFKVAFSDKERAELPEISDSDLDQLVSGNNQFAMDMYGKLADGEAGNLFMSPYSISLALTMAYAGASGGTADEMAETLKFALSPDRVHAAFNALDQMLAARGDDLELEPDEKFTLEVANSIWGQDGFEFEQEFLDTLAENYGAGMRLVDYMAAAEAARQAINLWVEDNTNDRIKDLIPQGVLTPDTVLVLANAIFFKAAWANQFEPEATSDGDFTLLDGSKVTAELMRQTGFYGVTTGENYDVVEMPYVGEQTSMVVIMPNEGEFDTFEASLDADLLASITSGLSPKNIGLQFPKFQFESKFRLPEPLKELGMEQAFDPQRADFSAMRTPPPGLVITDVIHQSFVSVDEEGTEAAAATAVIIVTSAPIAPEPFVVDRPFIFLIRDIPTGTVLFMGRVLDPTAG